jgi:hypothetical protein
MAIGIGAGQGACMESLRHLAESAGWFIRQGLDAAVAAGGGQHAKVPVARLGIHQHKRHAAREQGLGLQRSHHQHRAPQRSSLAPHLQLLISHGAEQADGVAAGLAVVARAGEQETVTHQPEPCAGHR